MPYTFTAIDIPGATFTNANDINDSGQIVGSYHDATGGHGFVNGGGPFTTIDVPFNLGGGLAFETFVTGINHRGQLVGQINPGPTIQGFLYKGGTFTLIQPPFFGGQVIAAVNRINDRGQIVGTYGDGQVASSRGFLDTHGIFTSINVPFAVPFPNPPGGEVNVLASGINKLGQIVGWYTDATGGHGFLDSGGAFTQIDVPFAGATSTAIHGINRSGAMVGTYTDATGTHGFVESGGAFTQIDVPFAGATSTIIHAVNRFGIIVGQYTDATGTHGFLGTPN
jgi:uncharacterized membrane protein